MVLNVSLKERDDTDRLATEHRTTSSRNQRFDYFYCVSSARTVVDRVVRALVGSRADWRPPGLLPAGRPRFGFPHLGVVIIVITLMTGWWAFADSVGVRGRHVQETYDASTALFAGSVGIVAMTWTHILATRIRFLEPFFGGLDRAYRWHRWMGGIGIAGTFLHGQLVGRIKGIPGASKFLADTGVGAANISEVVLYILLGISLARWIPYRWWRLTHKLMFPAYVLACFHFYTAEKPFGNGEPWGRWYSTLMIIGITAGVYRLLWRDLIRRGRPYRVARLRRSERTVEVVLEPVGPQLRGKVGQFVFLRVDVKGLGEPHPYTIASAPEEREMRFFIRTDGDWGRRLSEQVAVGDIVMVEGPYGGTSPLPARTTRQAVWIAGGVGITPFLSAVAHLRTAPREPKPVLFYAVLDESTAIALDELRDAHEAGLIDLHVIEERRDGRMSGDDFDRAFPQGLRGCHIMFCGPHGLIRATARAAKARGARRLNIEEFDIRSGIGPDLTHDVDELIDATSAALAARRSR